MLKIIPFFITKICIINMYYENKSFQVFLQNSCNKNNRKVVKNNFFNELNKYHNLLFLHYVFTNKTFNLYFILVIKFTYIYKQSINHRNMIILYLYFYAKEA